MYHTPFRYLTLFLAIILLLPLLAGSLRSAESAAQPTEQASETAAPTPRPTPRKRGFFRRVFGYEKEPLRRSLLLEPRPISTPIERKPKPKSSSRIDPSKIKRAIPLTPEEKATSEESAPSPTPKPKARRTPKPKATPEPEATATATPQPTPKDRPKTTPTAKPAATPEPTPKATPRPTPNPTPSPEESASANFTAAPAFVPAERGDKQAPSVEDILSEDYQKKMQNRYDEVKKKAASDTAVADLKAIADAAAPGEEKEPLTAYYRALFAKMRALDPPLEKRIDRIEKATLSRLGEL